MHYDEVDSDDLRRGSCGRTLDDIEERRFDCFAVVDVFLVIMHISIYLRCENTLSSYSYVVRTADRRGSAICFHQGLGHSIPG